LDRVEEIEAAIDGLPPEEYRRIQWFRERVNVRWDKQMGRDSSAGKLEDDRKRWPRAGAAPTA
jgi:hypothetical protein